MAGLVILVGWLGDDAVRASQRTQASTVHVTDEGPLSARTLDGGILLGGPGEDPWTATFGGFQLCADTEAEPGADGGDIVLEDVRWDASLKPVAVHARLRAASDGPESIKWGSYPDFAEPYSDRVRYGGTPLPGIESQKISMSCANARDGMFIELLMVVTFDAGGGKVDTTYVDYTYDGDPYTLAINFGLTGCGPKLTEPDDIENCKSYETPHLS